jgi:hypothetical protein
MGASRTAPGSWLGTSVEPRVGKYLAEEKIRILLQGLRGEVSIAELCRKEGIGRLGPSR